MLLPQKIGFALLSGALSFAAHALLGNKGVKAKDTPQTADVRGSMVPFLLGRNRVGSVFAYVGARRTSKRTEGGFFGLGGTTITTYHEKGVQLLACGGIGKRLLKIYESGEVIYDGVLNRSSSPSGTQVTIPDKGTFRIYWGEQNQPVDAVISQEFGINTNFGGIMYIVWDRKNLGQSPVWAQLDYEIESESLINVPGASFPSWIDDSNMDDEDLSARLPGGMNPVSVLYSMLFSGYPYGMGVSSSNYDISTFLSVGEYFSASNVRTPVHVYVTGGDSYRTAIASILQDCGIAMPWNYVKGKYELVLMRSGSTATALDTEVSSTLEKTTFYDTLTASRTVFSFSDSQRNYKDSTIYWKMDGESELIEAGPNDNKVSLPTIQDFRTALEVSERRELEDHARAAIVTANVSKLKALDLTPGDIVTLPGDNLNEYIVSSIDTKDADAPGFQVSFFKSSYTSLSADLIIGAGGGWEPKYEAEEDTFARFFELPYGRYPNSREVAVLRCRAREYIEGSELHFSGSGVTYSLLGYDYAGFPGGELIDALPNNRPHFELQSVTIELFDSDISTLQDLSPYVNRYMSGEQIAIIDNEVCFVGKVTLLGGGVARLDYLVRGRWATDIATHAPGAKVIILPQVAFASMYSSAEMIVGSLLRMKSVTFTRSDSLDIGSVPVAYESVYRGSGRRPPSVGAIKAADNMSNTWVSGDDLKIKWFPRCSSFVGTGAGDFPAGGTTIFGGIIGGHVIRIYDISGTSLKRTIALGAVDEYTYSLSDMISDFGTVPNSLKVVISATLNGLESNTKSCNFFCVP